MAASVNETVEEICEQLALDCSEERNRRIVERLIAVEELRAREQGR